MNAGGRAAAILAAARTALRPGSSPDAPAGSGRTPASGSAEPLGETETALPPGPSVRDAAEPEPDRDALDVHQVLPVWPAWLTALTDLTLLAGVLLLPLLALVGIEGGLRRASALCLLALAPGWALLRALGVPPSTFTLVAAWATSTLVTGLLGLISVTRLGWSWPLAIAVAMAISLAGAFVVVRREQPHRTWARSARSPSS